LELLKDFINEQIYVEVSGNIQHKGILIALGTDIFVLFNGRDFLYIPMIHVHKINKKDDDSSDINPFEGTWDDGLNEKISFRKILNNARGVFSEITIANNQTIHGYVVSVMNNYVVFYSPVFKTVYISLQHLKWLIPYKDQQAPYDLSRENLPINPFNVPLARTFEEQLKRFMNQIVILDLGHDQNKIGQLQTIENNIVKLITARQTPSFVNLRHIKTIHIP
jgi:small nuclear ribonucleoprotein (snRNP)-like protein